MANPFDKFDTTTEGTTSSNPFDKFDRSSKSDVVSAGRFGDVTISDGGSSSSTKAFAKSAVEGLPGAAGGVAGAEAALALGAPAIVASGPWAPVTAVGLGLTGAVVGATAADKIATEAKKLVPEGLLKTLGFDDATRARERKESPYASFGGELASTLPFFRPGSVSKLERFTGAAIGGGIEAGQQAVEGHFDPTKIAMATAFQAGAPKATKLTEKIGGKFGRYDTTNTGKETIDPETGEITNYKPGAALKADLQARSEFDDNVSDIFKNKRIDPNNPDGAYLDVTNPAHVKIAEEFYFKKAAEELSMTPKKLKETLDKTGAKFEYEDMTKWLNGDDGFAKYKKLQKENLTPDQHVMLEAKAGNVDIPETTTVKNWVDDIENHVGVNIYAQNADQRIVRNEAAKMRKMVPEQTDRESVWEAISRGMTDTLTGAKKELADFYTGLMDKMGKEYKELGLIKGLVNDYATRIIDFSKVDPTEVPKLLKLLETRLDTMPTSSRFGKERTLHDFDEFMKFVNENGLKLKTTDLAEVFTEYANSMNKAKENRKLINKLKEIKLPGKEEFGIFLDTAKAPYIPSNYVRLQQGQFAGYAVHPEIHPALKFVMDAREPGQILKALSVLNAATKRLNIGFSFFHGSSLTVASLMANAPKDMNPFTMLRILREEILKPYHEGGLGDSADTWLRHTGLGVSVSEDVGKGSLQEIANAIDKFLYKHAHLEGDYVSKGIKPAALFQEKLDKLTWNILHDGLKLFTAEKYLEKAKIDHPGVPELELRKEIAQAVNNIYGGLDWYGIARESSNKFIKSLTMSALNPEGRRMMQILMFAPDWTLSTIKAFTDAIPKSLLKPTEWDLSKGLSGLSKPLTKGDYARRYQMRFALYYLTLFNGLNIALSGHPIWENKDPTTVDMGDGRTMATMKHPMEPIHWFMDYDKTLANKLGFAPKATIKTLAGVEYASPFAPKMLDPSMEGRMKAITKDIIPFSLGSLDKGWQETLSGFMGLPIRGMTPEQKAESQYKRAREKALLQAEKKIGVKALDRREDEE